MLRPSGVEVESIQQAWENVGSGEAQQMLVEVKDKLSPSDKGGQYDGGNH